MKRLLRASSLTAADAAAIVLLYPNWSSLRAGLNDPQAWVGRAGADCAIGTVATAALWAMSLWLGLGLLAAFSAALPGTTGAVARVVLESAMPAVARRTLAGALGLGILAAPVSALATPSPSPTGGTTTAVASTLATPAWPSGSPGRVAPPVPIPGWPVNTGSPPSSVGAASAASSPPAPKPHPYSRSVVVHPGDSLWLIASSHLGPRSQPRQIAAVWPRWYAANRAEIGPDANLIRPGQVLYAPEASR